MGCSSSAAEGKGRAQAQVHPQPGLLYAWVDFGELLMKVLSPHTDGFVSETLFQMSPNTDGGNVFIIIDAFQPFHLGRRFRFKAPFLCLAFL